MRLYIVMIHPMDLYEADDLYVIGKVAAQVGHVSARVVYMHPVSAKIWIETTEHIFVLTCPLAEYSYLRDQIIFTAAPYAEFFEPDIGAVTGLGVFIENLDSFPELKALPLYTAEEAVACPDNLSEIGNLSKIDNLTIP